jgi:hypothetical protein
VGEVHGLIASVNGAGWEVRVVNALRRYRRLRINLVYWSWRLLLVRAA